MLIQETYTNETNKMEKEEILDILHSFVNDAEFMIQSLTKEGLLIAANHWKIRLEEAQLIQNEFINRMDENYLMIKPGVIEKLMKITNT